MCDFRLCMVNYIILYKKFVEHHVIKLILLKISIEDIFNKINLITWCSTNCESCSAIAASFILIGYYAVKIKHLVYTKTVINSAYGREKNKTITL